MSIKTFYGTVKNLLTHQPSMFTIKLYVSNINDILCRILEAIDSIVANAPITNLSEPVVFSQRSFAVSVEEVNIEDFKQSGHTFSVNSEYFSNENLSLTFNDLVFGPTNKRPTAAISLPRNLLDGLSNINNSTRITYAVFITDSLFLRRFNTLQKVASIIISAAIVGSGSIKGLNPPVNLSFLLNPVSRHRVCD